MHRVAGGAGTQAQGKWPPEPRVLQTVLLSKLWHSSGLEVTANVAYGAIMVAGWGREWRWRIEDMLRHSSDAPTFVQHEGTELKLKDL